MSQRWPADDQLIGLGFPAQSKSVSAARPAWQMPGGDRTGHDLGVLINRFFFQFADNLFVGCGELCERGTFRFRTVLPDEDVGFPIGSITGFGSGMLKTGELFFRGQRIVTHVGGGGRTVWIF